MLLEYADIITFEFWDKSEAEVGNKEAQITGDLKVIYLCYFLHFYAACL